MQESNSERNCHDLDRKQHSDLRDYTSIRLGCFGVALFLVQHFLYSNDHTPKLVQHLLAPIKRGCTAVQ